MLDQYLAAKADEYEPTQQFGALADDRAERAAHQHPGARHRRNVTMPMTAQVTDIGCSSKAIVTPAAAASMLVATAIDARAQPVISGMELLSSSLAARLACTMRPPMAASRAKATQ